jgi:hypothetical protein
MMKRKKSKTNISKGAPSGFVISLIVHAAAFLLAGMLVVFTVHQKEEQKFVPPKPVDRPKMKLKKPKVKVKKTAKPKSTQRIVTKVKRASMPDIQLPEMSGLGDGLAGGIGDGFDIMPDLGEVTIFGAGQTIGNDFVGTFYDFKRDRSGRPISMSPEQFVDELIKFNSSGWRKSKLARFYRSPKKLYATSITMPAIRSAMAPAAFGEGDTIGYAWMVHYEGQLVHHEDIKFRFWGHGDDVMVVRVGGKNVLNACWPDEGRGTYLIGGKWQSSASKNRQYYLGNNLAVIGDWIELKAGEPIDMEMIIGEVPGGAFCSYLLVEVEGEEYERNRQGAPILPIFKTEEPSLDVIDTIAQHLIQTEATITGGPIFKDYASSGGGPEPAPEQAPEPATAEEAAPVSKTRLWTRNDGNTLEGDYLSALAGQVVLKTTKGRQIKIPITDLSEDDVRFVELSNPPDLSVTFTKSSSQRTVAVTPYLNEEPPKVLDYVFGAKIKQTSAYDYNHELNVEFFAVGQRLLNQNEYVLLDHQTSSFVPSAENQRSHKFSGEKIETMQNELAGFPRGIRYAENIVIVTDQRGEVVAHSSSAKWLVDNLDNLRKMPVGRFMDKTCTRIIPTGPKPTNF